MKKFLAILLVILTAVSFSACGGTNGGNADGGNSGSGDEPSVTESKVLVAYFSATNHTKKVAEYIAEATNGTLFELVPETPYTSSDLNYNSSSSRVSKEHDDESLRDIKLVSDTPANFEDYDVVFIGYPIWWGIAAWPVNNFVKNNDFSGKTVIPFATSASSGLGSSGSNLKTLAGNKGDWLDGRRFSSSESKSDVTNYIKSLNLK